MKKIISILLAIYMSITLVACGAKEETPAAQIPQEILGQQEFVPAPVVPTETATNNESKTESKVDTSESKTPEKENTPSQEEKPNSSSRIPYKLGDPIELKINIPQPASEEVAKEKQAFWEPIIWERKYAENLNSMAMNFADIHTMVAGTDAAGTNITRISGLFEGSPVSATLYITESKEVYYQERFEFGNEITEDWYKITDSEKDLSQAEALSAEMQSLTRFQDGLISIKYLGSENGIDFVEIKTAVEDLTGTGATTQMSLILELDPETISLVGINTTTEGYDVRVLFPDLSNEVCEIPQNITSTLTLEDAMVKYANFLLVIIMSATSTN